MRNKKILNKWKTKRSCKVFSTIKEVYGGA